MQNFVRLLTVPRKNISFRIYVNTTSTTDQKKSYIDYNRVEVFYHIYNDTN